MKTIMQVTIECDTNYNSVNNIIRREKMVLEKKNGKHYINKCQEDYLHQILYFEGKIKEITLESKINSDASIHP